MVVATVDSGRFCLGTEELAFHTKLSVVGTIASFFLTVSCAIEQRACAVH